MAMNTSPSSILVNGSTVDTDHFHLMIQAWAIPIPKAHSPLRLLVTGSRAYRDREAVAAVLLGLAQTHGPLFVLDGECPVGGLDQLAHDFAVEQGWPTRRMPADWRRYRKGAGRIRNQAMVDTHPDLCVGWPEDVTMYSSGTVNCLEKAAKAHIPTFYVSHDDRGRWAIYPFRLQADQGVLL